ncbi:MAG: hypothetical protein WA672_01530, partial [Candidatus Angelobacter sp.]
MTEQSEHLSSAQIENYGNRTSGAGPDAAQGDEHQRAANQPMADRHIDQSTADQSLTDKSGNDLLSNDLLANDQRVEAHLADCPSCRNRLLDFHRSHFALLAQPAGAGATSSSPGLADARLTNSKLADSKSADSKLAGGELADSRLADSTLAESKVVDSRLADSKLADSAQREAKPTDSALADTKFANSKYPAVPQVRTAATPQCLSDDALRQLAASLSSNAPISDTLAAKLTQHAATCDHCGPLLRTFTEDFSDDFTPEEQEALANLKSGSAEWQKNVARQMMQAARVSGTEDANAATARATEVGSSRTAATIKSDKKLSAGKPASTAPGRKPFFWKWVLVPATAAVVAIAAFSIWYTQRDTPKKVEQYLAKAYTEKRPMEMRWLGAEWGPPQIILGSAESVFSKPGPLIDAEKIINDHRAASSG